MSAWDNYYGAPTTIDNNVQSDGIGVLPCSVFDLDPNFYGGTGDDPARLPVTFLAEVITIAQAESGKCRVIKDLAVISWRVFNDSFSLLSVLNTERISSVGVGLENIKCEIAVSNNVSAPEFSIVANVSGEAGETISWHTSLTVRFWAPLFS